MPINENTFFKKRANPISFSKMDSAGADDLADKNKALEGATCAVRKEGLIRRFAACFSMRRAVSIILLLVFIGAGYGIYEKYFHPTDAERAKKELAAAVAGVSKLMLLPEGDEPVLAIVANAETLIKQQTFFAGAVNGDQLLLFPKSMKAVLWSPSRRLIVNVGPIQQQSETLAADKNSADKNTSASPAKNTATPAAKPVSPTGELSVEIRNGTSKNGLAAQIADQIRANAGYSIAKVADASAKKYTKTIVFDRATDGTKKQMISALVAALGAEVAQELPSGEDNTEADALVILGGQ